MDIMENIKFVLNFYKNEESRKWYVLTGLGMVGMRIVLLALGIAFGIVLALFLIGQAKEDMSSKEILAALVTPQGIALVAAWMIVVTIISTLLSIAIQAFFEIRFFKVAMREKALKVQEEVPYVQFVLLQIARSLAVLTSWHSRIGQALLLPLIGALLLSGMWLIGAWDKISGTLMAAPASEGNTAMLMALVMEGLMYAVLVGVAYLLALCVWWYNSLRLIFSNNVFVSGYKQGIMETMRASWEISEKKVLDIFIVWLVCGFVFGIALLILLVPFMIAMLIVSVAVPLAGRLLMEFVMYFVFMPFSLVLASYLSSGILAQIIAEKKLVGFAPGAAPYMPSKPLPVPKLKKK
jgi:hypothetical protein